MPKVHYEYNMSRIIEDSVEVPQEVLDKGRSHVVSFIQNVIDFEDYDYTTESDHTEINYVVEK